MHVIDYRVKRYYSRRDTRIGGKLARLPPQIPLGFTRLLRNWAEETRSQEQNYMYMYKATVGKELKQV